MGGKMPKVDWSGVEKRLEELGDRMIQTGAITRAVTADLEAAREAMEQATKEADMLNVTQITGKEHTGRWVEFYSCPSASDPKKSYVVAKDGVGNWGCSCPRWIFFRENCKHIKRVENTLRLGNLLAQAHINALDERTRRALDRIGRVEVDPTAQALTQEQKDAIDDENWQAGGNSVERDKTEGSERAARLEL
jgi:hypothetical protein